MDRKQQQPNRNAGFSLVEVVLSMAILAIISIPLLNYFSESLKYNSMMASKQKATLLAQEVAEELKEQQRLIQNSGTGYTIPYLENLHYEAEDSTNTLKSSTDGTGKVSFIGEADKIYKDYDVVVTAEATEPASDVLSTSYGINDKTDLLVIDGKQDEEALVYFKAVNTSYCAANEGEVRLTDDQIVSAMKRQILIAIATDSPGYNINVTYKYQCSGLQGASSVDSFTSDVLVDGQMEELKNIYLLYHLVQTGDKIEITKDVGVTISPNLYLACQNIDTAPSGYQVRIKNLATGTVHTNVNALSVLDDDTSLPITAPKLSDKLTEDMKTVRMVKFEVAVYKKGEAGVVGKEPYITVDASKGE